MMRSLLWVLCALIPMTIGSHEKFLDLDEWAAESEEEEKEVCYPTLGCFDNQPPFDNAGGNVPEDPTLIDTHFLLFTKAKAKQPEILQYENNDKSITTSQFNNSNWLRIIVHGFTNNRDSSWIPHMIDELLKLKDKDASDVLVVDWGNGAKLPSYFKAASNTRLVGKQISLLLNKMRNLKKLSYDKVHCIGHSLGSHTCAYASNGINNQMGRISGLDPAGPFFQGRDLAVRLDKNDAKFVDVIHTNTEIAFTMGLGSEDPSGHIDFFVNGGKHQPGCPTIGALFSGLFDGPIAAIFEHSSCSHSRAHGYFIESINSKCSYTAYKCADHDSFRQGKCLACPNSGCAKMGFYANTSPSQGMMYLATKTNSPFCGHHYYLELTLQQNMRKTLGEIFVAIYSNYEMLTNVSMTHEGKVTMGGGETFRHVFSHHDNLGTIDYAIVYFRKDKDLSSFFFSNADEIIISHLSIKSNENTAVFTGACKDNIVLPAFTSHTMLLKNRHCTA